ncbi:Phage portal protein, SPP1 Gp6-like [Streptomyces sp. 1222.2]|uniref:phage portal protein n=1 Tax=Streptomyces sp. 1222.2 TaxID=1938833 RepID=UPI000BD80A3E|nr:phage portal protein [Streptomyces sp. 1222.2]SOD80131.1 Phage portal protein, SPP1 Gp6-like [Streptomyces sp. 1222.2]
MPQPAVQSPEWWRDRLYKALCKRSKDTEVYDDYYECEHPLPFLHEKARDPFRRLLKMSRANYMELVVDALVGRLEVAGFQADSGDEDQRAWELWQDNNLDGGSALAFLEAAIRGEAYMLVSPPEGRRKGTRITPEHPTQVIVEEVPGEPGELAAALKLWLDDWTARLCATLYLPDRIYKFEAPEPKHGENPRWVRREVRGEEWGGLNLLREVPFGQLANRPRMLKPGASELRSVTGIQDRINKTIADRMMTQEYAAFPQKWVTGMEIPVDENGQPVQPFDVAVNRILMAEDDGARFGQFAAADLSGYLKGKEADVQDIAAITSTPPHYLLGSMINLSAEALKAAEAGLIHRIYQRRRFLEEGLERTMRLAGFASSQARIVWKSPEWRTEGELVDALVKMSSLGVPREVLWERWGATPQEVERWRRLSEDALARALEGDLAAEYGPKPTPGQGELAPETTA